jgi:1-acyl-sn-glycerol-3-phosphate acyltransferase
MLCYPHTSSWDFLYLKAAAWHYGLDISWFGKQELFRGALGLLMRALGGVPVNRSKAHHLVDSMVDLFASRERLILCIAPEGTRHTVEHWRSGFYHIARRAGVPLQLSMLDFGRRRIEISEAIHLSGDIRADMDKIRAFYRGATGLHAEMTGNIRLKEED